MDMKKLFIVLGIGGLVSLAVFFHGPLRIWEANLFTVSGLIVLTLCLICGAYRVWVDTEEWIIGCICTIIALAVLALAVPHSFLKETEKKVTQAVFGKK